VQEAFGIPGLERQATVKDSLIVQNHDVSDLKLSSILRAGLHIVEDFGVFGQCTDMRVRHRDIVFLREKSIYLVDVDSRVPPAFCLPEKTSLANCNRKYFVP